MVILIKKILFKTRTNFFLKKQEQRSSCLVNSQRKVIVNHQQHAWMSQ